MPDALSCVLSFQHNEGWDCVLLCFLLRWKEHESISLGVFSYVYVAVRAKVNLDHGIVLRGLRNYCFVLEGRFLAPCLTERFFIIFDIDLLLNRGHRQCQRELCQVQGRLLRQHGDQLHETSWPPEFGDQREGKRLDWTRRVGQVTLKPQRWCRWCLFQVDWSQYIAVNSATAHPHYGRDGSTYNMGNSYDKSGKSLPLFSFSLSLPQILWLSQYVVHPQKPNSINLLYSNTSLLVPLV